ncbi:PQQ enzyme repeat family protein [Orientia chuto str. Dubai]|uniref:PQQ enzyme repeat family protein n=1 Tax=Orientia chuto str. Dubai TaxID=1359168 RepID=A0A0F3MHZ5_9RICK|nr:PQQ-binding-like beta-propeller repeat protein [Candidatus Orientia mediorientalis]KJV55385.1 PQQ enzyme repeat family protein [Orientia chuto str. Dubai]
MNKKLSLISLLSLMLSNTTVYSIESSANLASPEAEISAGKVTLPTAISIHNWNNTNTSNVAIKEFITFNKIKLSDFISAPPIIVQDKLFVLNDYAQVVCYNLSNMKKVWIKELEHQYRNRKKFDGGSILFNNGRLYISYGSKNIVILNASNGTEILNKKLPDIVKAPPLIHNNLMLVLTVNKQLYCIDLTTADIIWIHQGAQEPLICNSLIAPIIRGNLVIASYSSDQIVALNLENGKLVWSISLGKNITEKSYWNALSLSSLVSQPIIDNDMLYIANEGIIEAHKFDLVDTENQKLQKSSIQWSKNIPGISNFNLIGNTLFITTIDGNLLAVLASSGEIIWITNLYGNNQDSTSIKGNKNKFFSRIKSKLIKLGPSNVQYTLVPIAVNNNIIVVSKYQCLVISSSDGHIVSRIPINKNPKFFAISSDKLYIFGDRYVNTSN